MGTIPRGWPVIGWALVRTKQGQERTAVANLERQGVRCFLPLVQEKRGQRLAPLFPGYLFVQPPPAWGFINNTIGVRSLLITGGRPSLVPRAVMKALRRSLNDEGYMDLTDEPPPPVSKRRLKPGVGVTIHKGVFKSHAAVYKAVAPGDRIRVVLDFMGQETEFVLDRKDVTER